jgi:hypothetical protein
MPNPPLVEKARALLDSGRIPRHRPERILAGPGTGRDRCPVCEDEIRAEEVVWEAEFAGPSGTIRHSFHVRCFRLLELHWRREEGEFDRKPAPERRR